MVADDIRVYEETNSAQHARLNSDNDLVPAGDVIALVHGDGADPVPEEFLTRLKMAATLIGDHTDVVRAAVKQNAAALKQAATDLMQVDDDGASQFATIGAIVDGTVTDTSSSDERDAQHFANTAGGALDGDGDGDGDGGSQPAGGGQTSSGDSSTDGL